MSDDELSNNIPELKRLIINQHNEISEKDVELSKKDLLIQELQDKIALLQRKQSLAHQERESRSTDRKLVMSFY